MSETPMDVAELREQAQSLRLHGLLAHWSDVMAEPQAAHRVAQWLRWELQERGRRSLERRLRDAHIGQFKPVADFDWSWPTQIDRAAIEELMTLQFLADATNVVFAGPNGVGKTMCACNLGYQAVLAGHTVLFITAGQLLGDLIGMDAAGMPLAALFDPQARAHLAGLLEVSLLRPATLEISFICDAGPDAPALRGKLAILPVETDGTRGELGIGVLALTGKIGRAPRHLILTGARSERIDLPRYHKLTELEDFSVSPTPSPIRSFAVKPTRSGRPYLQLVDPAR